MKKLFVLLLVLISGCVYAGYTKGYYRSNGKYVQPYYKSSPNSSPYDNQGYYNSSNKSKYVEDYYND